MLRLTAAILLLALIRIRPSSVSAHRVGQPAADALRDIRGSGRFRSGLAIPSLWRADVSTRPSIKLAAACGHRDCRILISVF